MDYQETKAIWEVIDEITDILYELHEKYNELLSYYDTSPFLSKVYKSKKEYFDKILANISVTNFTFNDGD